MNINLNRHTLPQLEITLYYFRQFLYLVFFLICNIETTLVTQCLYTSFGLPIQNYKVIKVTLLPFGFIIGQGGSNIIKAQIHH